jgi:uncharacterized protein YcfJ
VNKTILGLALAGAASLSAAHAETYGDVARVVSSTPVYERVAAPRRECRNEPVVDERRPRLNDGYRTAGNESTGAGAIVGAIIGGVIGHQFGNSSGGRDRATAAGAIVGGLVGNSIERESAASSGVASTLSPGEKVVEAAPPTREVERCREVPEARELLVGYDVLFEFHGRQMRARMPYDPGPEMPVNVDVRPPAAQQPAGPGPTLPRYRSS